MSWHDRALCLDADDPEIFFAQGASASAVRDQDKAKRICVGCPVLDECFQDAMSRGIAFGIFGGLTIDERRHVARNGLTVTRAMVALSLSPRARRGCTRCRKPFFVDDQFPQAKICSPCASTHPDPHVRRYRQQTAGAR